MIYTKSIQVDMARQGIDDAIRLHEGDALGAQLQISMFNAGAAFDLTGFSVKYDAVIAGYLAENNAAADATSNIITIPITANMCAKSGTLEIDVKIIEGTGQNEKVLFLQKFEATVQRRVINEDVIIDVSGTTIGEKIAALEARFPVKNADIDDMAVTGRTIADYAVGTNQIAAGAVISTKIGDGAVKSDKIANGAVTTVKIASGAVTTGKLDSMAVTEGKIGNNAVTSDKIAAGAVGLSELNSEVSDHFMELAPTITTESEMESVRFGQMVRYESRYYIKNSASPAIASNVGLANMNDVARLDTRIDSLQNIVGDANDILEATLHYQNGG